MKKNLVKGITIFSAIAVFGIGAAFAFNVSGSANKISDAEVSVQAAGNVEIENIDSVVAVDMGNNATEAVKVETAETVETVEAQPANVETTEAVEVQPTVAAETNAVVVTETTVATEAVKPVSNYDNNGYVDQVFSLINDYRNEQGVSYVTFDATLTQMAMTRANEMASANFFVIQDGHHMRPDGREASTVAEDYNQYGRFGEIMGRYQTSAEEIVTGWIGSSTHRACMINSTYSRVGIGYGYDSEGYIYWVAIFMD